MWVGSIKGVFLKGFGCYYVYLYYLYMRLLSYEYHILFCFIWCIAFSLSTIIYGITKFIIFNKTIAISTVQFVNKTFQHFCWRLLLYQILYIQVKVFYDDCRIFLSTNFGPAGPGGTYQHTITVDIGSSLLFITITIQPYIKIIIIIYISWEK